MAAALCTSGPGATNFVTGLYTAQIDSIPPDRHHRPKHHRPAGQRSLPVRRHRNYRPTGDEGRLVHPQSADVPGSSARPSISARSDQPGPVLIDLPLDVPCSGQDHSIPVPHQGPLIKKTSRQALALVLEAERPVLLAGAASSWPGRKRKQELAGYRPAGDQYLHSQGRHPPPSFVCGAGWHQIGTPFGNKFFLGKRPGPGHRLPLQRSPHRKLGVYIGDRRFIHIDVDPHQIGKIVPAELGIVADAKLAIAALLAEAQETRH